MTLACVIGLSISFGSKPQSKERSFFRGLQFSFSDNNIVKNIMIIHTVSVNIDIIFVIVTIYLVITNILIGSQIYLLYQINNLASSSVN
jgi:hypothetical protein